MIENTRKVIRNRHKPVSHRMRLLSFSFASLCVALALGMGWLKVKIEIIGYEQVHMYAQVNAQIDAIKEIIEEQRKPDYRFYRDI